MCVEDVPFWHILFRIPWKDGFKPPHTLPPISPKSPIGPIGPNDTIYCT